MKIEHQQAFAAALDKFGAANVRVGGWSMWPFIRNSEVIKVVKKLEPPYVGKVVAFFEGDQLIVHRIVWQKRGNENRMKFWIQGDFSRGSLAEVEEDRLVGTVVGKENGNILRNLWFFHPFCSFALVLGFLIRNLWWKKTRF